MFFIVPEIDKPKSIVRNDNPCPIGKGMCIHSQKEYNPQLMILSYYCKNKECEHWKEICDYDFH